MLIGIIGYGSVGKGLGHLFLEAGHSVVVGVRDLAEASQDAMDRMTIQEAAQRCEVAVLAVPYAAIEGLAPMVSEGLTGKIVIDATNPLSGDWSPLDLGGQNSAGESIQTLLPESQVVKAFNTVFADNFTSERLRLGERRLNAFIAGDEERARDQVVGLAEDAGFDPIDVGDLKNARYLEAIAHLNIQLALGKQRGTNSGFLYFDRG